jgi:hypothetical protein
MKQKTLKINIFDKVDVKDVFIATKMFVEKTIKHIFVKARDVFNGDKLFFWRAIPIRGPDIKGRNFYNFSQSYASLA